VNWPGAVLGLTVEAPGTYPPLVALNREGGARRRLGLAPRPLRRQRATIPCGIPARVQRRLPGRAPSSRFDGEGLEGPGELQGSAGLGREVAQHEPSVGADGVAAAVVPSPFFDRKLDADAWNLASLVVPALLFGPLAATYLVPWPSACRVGGRAGVGGALSFLAAGCPVCNKLVVLAIGTTGAVEFFRPIQPALGAISVLLLGIAFRARWQTRAPSPIAGAI
jgi:hypothetical protein